MPSRPTAVARSAAKRAPDDDRGLTAEFAGRRQGTTIHIDFPRGHVWKAGDERPISDRSWTT